MLYIYTYKYIHIYTYRYIYIHKYTCICIDRNICTYKWRDKAYLGEWWAIWECDWSLVVQTPSSAPTPWQMCKALLRIHRSLLQVHSSLFGRAIGALQFGHPRLHPHWPCNRARTTISVWQHKISRSSSCTTGHWWRFAVGWARAHM